MNGTRQQARGLIADIRAGLADVAAIDVVVCPSFVLLPEVAAEADGSALQLGAQDVSEHDNGAYTGEVSATMLADFDCRFPLVGHSERRQYHGENNVRVAAKFVAARQHGLQPILCLGETLEEREAGRTEKVVGRQLDAVLDAAGVAALRHAVVAYEPVWAIGTGRTATPDQAQEVHAFIRSRVAAADADVAAGLRIVYGGSMKPDNAAGLLAQPDIDGGLIGGASLAADDFLAICRSAVARTIG